MSYLLAIDPGISSGWSLWDRHGTLLDCDAGPRVPVETAACRHAVIELPTIYPRAEADPNDLIKLALQVGANRYVLEQRSIPVLLVQPRTWKGQVPKSVHHPRILEKIKTDTEKFLISSRSRSLTTVKARGDMMDAIGLGQWWFTSGKCL